MLSGQKTKPLNRNNSSTIQNVPPTTAIYMDSSALFYTAASGIEFYPGALEFIKKSISKNLMFFIFSPDEKLNIIKAKISQKKSTNPSLKSEILDGLNLNLKETADNTFRNKNIFIVPSLLLKKEVGDRSKIIDDSEFGQILNSKSKKQNSAILQEEAVSDEIIIIHALSEFTKTNPLVFAGPPELSRQAKDQGIPFIIEHPMVEHDETITTPTPKNGILSRHEKERSKQFFEAVDAYRLLKDYVAFNKHEEEKSKTRNSDYFKEKSIVFLTRFEEGHIYGKFCEDSEELKFLTNNQKIDRYFLKRICNTLYKGIISRYAYEKTEICRNFFDAHQHEIDGFVMIDDYSSNTISKEISLNSNIIENNDFEKPMAIKNDEIFNVPRYDRHSYGIDCMPYLFKPSFSKKTNKIELGQKKQVAYFSSHSLFILNEKTSISDQVIESMRKLIELGITVVIITDSFSETSKTIQFSNFLLNQLSTAPTYINYHYLEKHELQNSLSKNFLFLLDLQPKLDKERKEFVVTEPGPKDRQNKLNTLSAISRFSALTQTEVLMFVDSVFENNSLLISEQAYQLNISFIIAYPYIKDRRQTITRENTNYKDCPVSAQFFDALVAYAELELYVKDESRTDQPIAIALLSVLREGHRSLSFDAAFRAIMSPELEQLYKRLYIGLISKYFNQNPAIGGTNGLLVEENAVRRLGI